MTVNDGQYNSYFIIESRKKKIRLCLIFFFLLFNGVSSYFCLDWGMWCLLVVWTIDYYIFFFSYLFLLYFFMGEIMWKCYVMCNYIIDVCSIFFFYYRSYNLFCFINVERFGGCILHLTNKGCFIRLFVLPFLS